MKKLLLDKIPVDVIGNMKLYRLGVFGNCSFELVELKKSEKYPEHYHKSSEAEFYFILGEGKIVLNGKEHKCIEGDIFKIAKGMKHGFRPKKETLFLSVQKPPIKDRLTGKEDIHF